LYAVETPQQRQPRRHRRAVVTVVVTTGTFAVDGPALRRSNVCQLHTGADARQLVENARRYRPLEAGRDVKGEGQTAAVVVVARVVVVGGVVSARQSRPRH
jgi:hypothetical protein